MGLVGIGGVIFVPDLIYVGGWRIQEAVAASLAIVLFTAALVEAAGYILTSFGDLLSLPPLVVGSIAGAHGSGCAFGILYQSTCCGAVSPSLWC